MFTLRVGKIAICLVAIWMLGAELKAQRFHAFDKRKFNLGFTMGMNIGRYNMTSFTNLIDPESNSLLKRVNMYAKPGFNIGLITSFKIMNNMDFRFTPSVSLEQRDFDFIIESKIDGMDSINTKKIESSYLNLPFVIKFKSNFYKAYRVYVQFGIQYSINMASTKKVKNDPDLLKTESTDICFVSSFGIDLYGERLKLNPEIRYSMGLTNIYVPKNTRFANGITDLFSQSLMILINFE